MRRYPGFTVLELLVVIIIIGIATTVAFPKMNSMVKNEGVRSARRETITQLARARSIAVQRGCRSSIQMRAATSKVWVESCKASGAAGRDTIGSISLFSNYNTTFTTTADSLPFGPNSLGMGTATITMTFLRAGANTLSLNISSLGKPTW